MRTKLTTALVVLLVLSVFTGGVYACYSSYAPWEDEWSTCHWDFFYCLWYSQYEYCRTNRCSAQSCSANTSQCLPYGACDSQYGGYCGGSDDCQVATNGDPTITNVIHDAMRTVIQPAEEYTIQLTVDNADVEDTIFTVARRADGSRLRSKTWADPKRGTETVLVFPEKQVSVDHALNVKTTKMFDSLRDLSEPQVNCFAVRDDWDIKRVSGYLAFGDTKCVDGGCRLSRTIYRAPALGCAIVEVTAWTTAGTDPKGEFHEARVVQTAKLRSVTLGTPDVSLFDVPENYAEVTLDEWSMAKNGTLFQPNSVEENASVE